MAIIDQLLSYLTLVSGILIVLYVFDWLFVWMGAKQKFSSAWDIIGRNPAWFALIVAFAAMAGSLYYSDYMGYEPCKLCWYQRIFMYPQVFLFAAALWKQDRARVWTYSALLSIIGAVIALFHYYIQMSKAPIIPVPCSAVGGYSASCTTTFITHFGYITIPMMALTAFIAILIIGKLRVKAVN